MNKGMSQTLALIVAASVLMMTALTVILLARGSLLGIGDQGDAQQCISEIETRCSIEGSIAGPPATCFDSSNNKLDEVENAESNSDWTISGPDSASCG